MKRLPGLRALSEDHHHGLVLAQKAKKAGAGAAGLVVGETWAEVERQFTAALEPHFLIEETLLAPALDAAGKSELTKRLFEDHRAIRDYVRPASGRTPADLRRFGEVLENHIRFEERELFEIAEDCLSPEALEAVAMACRESRS